MTARVLRGWEDRGRAPNGDVREEAAATAEPVDALPEPPVEADENSTLGLVELLLKDPVRVDRQNCDQAIPPLPRMKRFLGIALASYVLFGVAMVVILNLAPQSAYPRRWIAAPPARLDDGSALALIAAFTLGLVAATCICLPSFYFFALLAGVKLSMLQITAQVLRCKSASALVLVGVLPIYVALVLGMIVFGASAFALETWLYIGLVLPFLAGLEGVRSIYRGVMGMADTLPAHRRERRECFFRRLTLSWAAVYMAVSPVMIYRLWEFLAGAH